MNQSKRYFATNFSICVACVFSAAALKLPNGMLNNSAGHRIAARVPHFSITSSSCFVSTLVSFNGLSNATVILPELLIIFLVLLSQQHIKGSGVQFQ
jgi:hypothetical protein